MKKLIVLLFFIAGALFLSHGVFAQVDVGLNYGEAVGLGNTDPRDMAVNIIRIALGFLGIIAIIVILYAGWLWTTSAGDAAKIDKAKKVLLNGFIGLILIFAAFGITQFVISRFMTATSGSCTPLATRSCGCGGTGTQVCNVGGTWDPCPPVCIGATPCCCGNGTYCDSCPCPTGSTAFTINVFSPANGASGVIRNKNVRVAFSHNIDATTVQGNFRLIKTAGTGLLADGINCGGDPFNCVSDRCDIAGTGNCIGNIVASSTLAVGGNRITFTPFSDCPAPYSAWKCFDANATYQVQANFAGPIQRAGDSMNLTCGPPPCSSTFDTGAVVDTQSPSSLNLGVISNLCIDTVNNINASANDDSGVDYFEFSDSFLGLFDTDNAPVCVGTPPNMSCSGVGIWNPTTAGGYVAGNTYAMTLDVMDLDSNQSSLNRSLTLRQSHCCDGILSGDETGVDCGGSCAACEGAACGASAVDDCAISATDCSANNNLCASGFCECLDPVASGLPYDCQSRGYDGTVGTCCLCQNAPIIDWVTPQGGFCRDSGDNPINTNCMDDSDCVAVVPGPGICDTKTANGAVGNLVTIGGRYFGDATGTVEFANGAAWVPASLANTLNHSCHDSWTDTEIIAVVPVGIPAPIAMTDIRVSEGTTGNFYHDTTGIDGRGSPIDFVVNTINRPGLCRISPDNGVINSTVLYYGISTNGSTASFGNLNNRMAALTSNFPSILPGPQNGDATVPGVQVGRTSTFVISGAGVASNFLSFTKNGEAVLGPVINAFDPLSGAEGQYVTIYGNGFGRARKAQIGVSHHVYFDLNVGDNTIPANYGTEANYSFPDICADNLWQDNQIIVKVPAGLVNTSNYYIVIDVSGWSNPIDSSAIIPSAVASPTFLYDQTAALKPSLCLIRPAMGPANIDIELWGEYFDAHNNANSIVRFNYNQDQSGVLAPTGPLIDWDNVSYPNYINSFVPVSAATGPVRVVKGVTALAGNGLIFRVGNCSADADCGTGSVCCPSGSFQAGRCETEVVGDIYKNCFTDTNTAVYEWDFNTGGGPAIGDPCFDAVGGTTPFCNPVGAVDCTLSGLVCDSSTCSCQPANVLSCQGFGPGQCANNLCPNSPGNCSFYPGGNALVTSSCDDSICNGLGGVCSVPPCSFNNNINRCDNGVACELPNTVTDALGNNVQAYCEMYGSPAAGRWFMNTNLSCPAGWTSVGGGRCMENLPSTCTACAGGFNCFNNLGVGVCAVDQEICPPGSPCNTVTNNCERPDKSNCECCCRIGVAFAGLDCCAPLDCTGDCGDDANVVAGGGPDPNLYGYCSGCANAGTTQADHDSACNCSGSTGKYCDSGDSRYPSGVCRDCAQLSTTTECNLHSATCCVDAMHSDNCRGGDGSAFGGNCEYYSCNTATPYDCLGPALTGTYGTSTCDFECAAPGPLGGRSCYQPTTDLCSITCGTGHTCLGDNGCVDNLPFVGCGATGNANDCRCCCDPSNDQCGLINADLTCTPNKTPCDTQFRGLCCGCIADSDCSTVVPTTVGCGVDSCCHQRPSIFPPVSPSGIGVCRNPLVRVEFNELMDSSSFSGNVYLVGDYGTNLCPPGTTFLAKEETNDRVGLARVFSEVALFVKRMIQPISRMAWAQPAVNYCAVPGATRGYNAGTHGVLTFSPTVALDATTTYYVIIRGDSDPTDSASNGVLNSYGVGFLAATSPTFSGITYNNSYFWSFDTGSEICRLDYIDQDPESWLFTSSRNDTADDPIASPLYDTIYDADKVFYAYSKTTGNQNIVRLPGVYDWIWNWTSDNPGVAQVTSSDDPIQVVTAQNRQDAKTYVRARATISADVVNNPATVNRVVAGRSHIYVFLCENPWPPRDPVSGSWSPWADDVFNCTIPVTGCTIDNHFELYYCRDAGGKGSADDLPSIASSSTIIRGMAATSSILKEFYFFREATPLATNTLIAVDLLTGGSVQTAWTPEAGADGYRLYYGLSPKNYSEYVDVGLVTSYAVNGLTNNVNYYFAFTSYFNNGAESEYSNETIVKPTDQTPPPVPLNLSATAGNNQAQLSWTANADIDTDKYKVYIGTATGLYGTSQEVGDVDKVVVGGLTNGVRYYFVVSAIDKYGNESAHSNEVFADVIATASLPSSGTTAVLVWSATGAVGEYSLYYEVIP